MAYSAMHLRVKLENHRQIDIFRICKRTIAFLYCKIDNLDILIYLLYCVWPHQLYYKNFSAILNSIFIHKLLIFTIQMITHFTTDDRYINNEILIVLQKVCHKEYAESII